MCAVKDSTKSQGLLESLLAKDDDVIALIKRSVSFVTGKDAPKGLDAVVRSNVVELHDHEWRCATTATSRRHATGRAVSFPPVRLMAPMLSSLNASLAMEIINMLTFVISQLCNVSAVQLCWSAEPVRVATGASLPVCSCGCSIDPRSPQYPCKTCRSQSANSLSSTSRRNSLKWASMRRQHKSC